MTEETDWRKHRAEILRIASLHGARNLRVFGSHARAEATCESDLDVLVDLDAHRSLLDLIALKQDMEDLLGCTVDVVTEASVSPYLRDSVRREAVPL